MNLSVQISSSIASLLPHVVIGLLQCKVSNTSYNDELWTDIEDYSKQFKQTYQLADINQRETIAATREAYRKTGKEPNRYRPSAEALCRRLVKGESLYRISTIVDCINLISVKTGYSIGGFDRDSIIGNSLELGIGDVLQPRSLEPLFIKTIQDFPSIAYLQLGNIEGEFFGSERAGTQFSVEIVDA